MRRLFIAAGAALVALALLFPATQASSTPVAASDAEYTALGRVFPDPHGCNAAGSPFAKGLACATDFLQYSEMQNGLKYLETLFPDFVEFYQLDEDFDCSGLIDLAAREYRVIAFDRPGFGHSERPRNIVWTPYEQAKLLKHALQKLRVPNAVVFGHSGERRSP